VCTHFCTGSRMSKTPRRRASVDGPPSKPIQCHKRERVLFQYHCTTWLPCVPHRIRHLLNHTDASHHRWVYLLAWRRKYSKICCFNQSRGNGSYLLLVGSNLHESKQFAAHIEFRPVRGTGTGTYGHKQHIQSTYTNAEKSANVSRYT
jgi:hypothetical protein